MTTYYVDMSYTSEKAGNAHPFPPGPPRPAVFDRKPVQSVQTQNRMGSAKTLRKALMSAADQVGGEEGLTGYLKFLASSDSASDRTSFVSLLGKLLPRAHAVAIADQSHAVQVVLPWLQESRAVDKIATPSAPGGVVIDQQSVENIDESDV
tara:strand:- start:3492 stop:3944 length:453 start_codon:yes stop_codon:yes gene_type:complete